MAKPSMPPGPRGLPVIGVLREVRKDGPAFLQQCAAKYGDVVYLPTAGQHVYFLNHPDHVREVLVTQQHKFKKSRVLERAKTLLGEGLLTSEGAFHLRQRRLVQPAFHRERLAGYGETMVPEGVCGSGAVDGGIGDRYVAGDDATDDGHRFADAVQRGGGCAGG